MTIGIGVIGPKAGLAAFKALAAVERVGRGAIGGFVSFVAITADGELHRAETQRGGTSTLFTDGERTGAQPPPAIAEAPIAGLMSSGPDRPAPLSQFTPAAANVGIVTGHRLPNMPGPCSSGSDGVPLNQAVLARMQAGEPAGRAAATILDENPEADAGIIALGIDGDSFVGNTAHVARRGDLGQAVLNEPSIGATIVVLHNAIYPHRALANLAAEIALDVMAPIDRLDFRIRFSAGTPLELGSENVVHVDQDGNVQRITVTQKSWLGSSRDGAVIDFAATVRQSGHLIGHTIAEPYCIVEHGRLISLSGSDHAMIGVRAIRGASAP